MSLPFDAVKATALARARSLLPAWLPGGRWEGPEWVALNPKRPDRSAGSLSVNADKGVWRDFATDEGGADLVSLFAWLEGLDQGQACRILAERLGVPLDPTPRQPATPAKAPSARVLLPIPPGTPRLAAQADEEDRWTYRDAAGRPLFVRVRTTHPVRQKTVKTWCWCELAPDQHGWRCMAPPKPWPLYGLERLAAHPAAPVLVVEGEKTVGVAQALYPDWVVVTSGSATSARSADWTPLRGRRVWIWPDADEAGRRYARDVDQVLQGMADHVAVVALSEGLPSGWDLADPVPDGVLLPDLLRLEEATSARSRDHRHPTLPLPAASGPWRVGDVARMLREDPPPVRWLVEGLIPAGVPGIFAARAGAGKSTTALLVALGLASGRGVLGRPVSPDAALGVLYVSMEDDEQEVHRRFRRGVELFAEEGWTREDEARLRERFRPLFPERASGETFSLATTWRDLAERARAIPGGCGLIILDTLARLSVGDENAAADMRKFTEPMAALAEATGATVLAIHHVGKGNDAQGDKKLLQRLSPEALRGSSAIEASARFILTLAALSPQEAQAAGLDTEKAIRGAYVALHLAKISQAEKGDTRLLERRAGDAPGAGFLCPHPRSEHALSAILGASCLPKPTKRDQVLLAIAEAGHLGSLDQAAVAASLWEGAKDPAGQLRKQLSTLRSAGWLSEIHLTPAGVEQVRKLGFPGSGRNRAGSLEAPRNEEGRGVPPGAGASEHPEQEGYAPCSIRSGFPIEEPERMEHPEGALSDPDDDWSEGA